MNTICHGCLDRLISKEDEQKIVNLQGRFDLTKGTARNILKRFIATEQSRMLLFEALDCFGDPNYLNGGQTIRELEERKLIEATHTLLESIARHYSLYYAFKAWSH